MVSHLLESIIFIIDAVLPLLRKLPLSIVEELVKDLKQMIARRDFLTVVHACIKYYNCYHSFISALFHPGINLIHSSVQNIFL